MSTEAIVRDKLVSAIRAIAQSGLGFDTPYGNVKPYPWEAHEAEHPDTYFMAKVGGVQRVRCWAVNVLAHDAPLGMMNTWTRVFNIEITGYYAKGKDAEGYLALVDHGTAVRDAIRSLTDNLGGTVGLVTTASDLRIRERTGLDVGKIWEGTMTYTAEKANP